MPLREDLLEPIAGANPSGNNLYYDKVFDQIKEARFEEEELGSAGAWERAAKRADHVLVIKLAGETLAKRTKDLRLAGWLIESHLKREGIVLLAPCLELLWKLQDIFWETIYPEIDEDSDLGLRVSAVEGPVNRIAGFFKNLPITKSGFGAAQYSESRRLGYEAAADTSEKMDARNDSINQGQITAEEFDIAAAATSKDSFVAVESALVRSLELLEEMGAFQESKYGDDYPGMNKLVTSVQEVKQIVSGLLNERRQIEPDVVVDLEPEPEPDGAVSSEAAEAPSKQVESHAAQARPSASVPAKTAVYHGTPTTEEQAYAAVLQGALFLHEQAPESPVPYLVCSGLRFGETRAQGAAHAEDFSVAPTTETRQRLKRMANEANWSELIPFGLRTLATPCARAWLDLQRYLWRGAVDSGADTMATAIISTVRGLLVDIPEMRNWTLDDDTPAANAETQQWIETEILPPAPVVQEETPALVESTEFTAVLSMPADVQEVETSDLYEEATSLVDRGKTGEAITLLVRDAALQPSGRTRFQRRVQVAQLCMQGDEPAIAYPLLVELSREIERRCLETWETGEMLAYPLSLLLQCLDRRKSSADEQKVIFEQLCRLAPQAAYNMRR